MTALGLWNHISSWPMDSLYPLQIGKVGADWRLREESPSFFLCLSVCFWWTDILFEVPLNVDASSLQKRGFLPAAVTETIRVSPNICKKSFNSEKPEELSVSTSQRCVSQAYRSPIFEFWNTSSRPVEEPCPHKWHSGFLRPSPTIMRFSWCSLCSLIWKDGSCSCSFHLWDVLVVSLYPLIS